MSRMRPLIISLVQSINGSFAQDGWSTGVSTDTDFRHFLALRRRASALVIDKRKGTGSVHSRRCPARDDGGS